MSNESEKPIVLDQGAVAPAGERDPGWWVPAAVVIGFFLIANYVWLGFLSF